MLRLHRVLIGAGSFYILNLFADDLYKIWWWFDILTHAMGGATIGILGIALHQWAEQRYGIIKRPWWWSAIIILGFVALIAILWEVYEYLLDIWVLMPQGLAKSQPSLRDTIGDLVMGLLGGLIAILTFRKRI